MTRNKRKIRLCFIMFLILAGLYWVLTGKTSHQQSKAKNDEDNRDSVQADHEKRQMPFQTQTLNEMTVHQQSKGENLRNSISGVQTVREKEQMPKKKQSYNQSPVNVYDISKVEVVDRSLCGITRTPSVFIICIYDKDKDRFISRSIYNTGQWEPIITKTIHDVLDQPRNITFIDLGANIGYFSLFAASIGQPVIAVEPWEKHIAKLAKSIHFNKFENKITVIQNAVSNTRRVARFKILRNNKGGVARIINEQISASINSSFNATTIVLNDLTDLIATKDIAIKLNIEGHECRALEMANEIFERFNVLFISMELKVMQNDKYKRGTACPAERIQLMIDMLTIRGFIPYSYYDNIPLDPKKDEMWIFFDIYWKRKDK